MNTDPSKPELAGNTNQKLKILAIAHGLWRGGAQEATLEMLRLLKAKNVEVRVLSSESAEASFLLDIKKLGLSLYVTHGQIIAKYPDLTIEKQSELVKSSDIVWITDVEYLVAPKIKRIRQDIPIVAHLHSYAVACPIWSAYFGMRETCDENCSHSLQRFTQCKRLAKQYMINWHRESTRIRAYQLLNYPKSYLDFAQWPMNDAVVRSIDGFVSVSEFTKNLVREHLPQLREVPFKVVPNPVLISEPDGVTDDVERSREDVLYASGPGMEKGPHIALCAARKLLDAGCNLKLIMLRVANDGWIKGLTKRLRLENHVTLTSILPMTEVLRRMANSAVVLMPSLYPEPFGRIPVEANLLGTPAVVSDRGALPSVIVDKLTGFVTEPSVDELANALSKALKMNWDRKQIAEVTRARFQPERIINDFISFLETFN